MLTNLTLEGYRGFKSFSLSGLGRVNLFIGKNNSGKTSILEAIQLLNSGGSPNDIIPRMSYRGERFPDDDKNVATRSRNLEIDICHLFNGHRAPKGCILNIIGVTAQRSQSLTMEVSELSSEELDLWDVLPPTGESDEVRFGPTQLKITAPYLFGEDRRSLRLTYRGGLTWQELERFSRDPRNKFETRLNTCFISTESVSFDFVSSIWAKIALTPQELLIVEALRILTPSIEGFRVFGNRGSSTSSRAGVIIKCSGEESPVPIGSFGEGMWRVLALTMALIRSENGFLLIDEIDTGLHYTVMEKVWRMIAETAKKLNVQVFATTHSSDCVASLAAICHDNVEAHDVTIHRINPQFAESTSFSEKDIIEVANSRLEIR